MLNLCDVYSTDLTIHVAVCEFGTTSSKSEQFYFFQYYVQTACIWV